jgi:hypothetical protein
MRDLAERRAVVAVDDEARDLIGLVGNDGCSRTLASGTSASAYCAATRSSPDAAAMPASSSPLRAGDAFASSVLRSPKT